VLDEETYHRVRRRGTERRGSWDGAGAEAEGVRARGGSGALFMVRDKARRRPVRGFGAVRKRQSGGDE
jgi:hypothetical protein